nr:aldo/keto reductase [Leptolyngbyaceae cyanobacterium MO_188.B28]
LNQLKQHGKIRAIGVSNFSQAELEAAMQYGKIESLQPPYSLFWRHVETDAMPFCIENDLSILAYSSLAQGLLTGKFDLDHDFPKGDVRASNRLFQGDLYQRAQAALAELRPIAERYQTTLGNLCLAWLIAQPQTCAIVGARNAAQSIENALAADLSLDPEDIAEMDAIAFSVTDHIDENPVMWNLDK